MPQSALLCDGHSDQTKPGTFKRKKRSAKARSSLLTANGKRPYGLVHFVPDGQLRSSVAIRDYVESSECSMVFVSPEYAHKYKSVPKDGRTYIVADPHRKHVLHWTYPDGTYECTEKATYPHDVPGMALTIHAKRVKGQPSRKKKRPRIADEFIGGSIAQCPSDNPPAICLIDINRVMRITGFRKSFIYEQSNFPAPVRLGATQRSAVRWIEAEIYQWVNALAAKRPTNSIST